jgi:hypothetical protein
MELSWAFVMLGSSAVKGPRGQTLLGSFALPDIFVFLAPPPLSLVQQAPSDSFLVEHRKHPALHALLDLDAKIITQSPLLAILDFSVRPAR